MPGTGPPNESLAKTGGCSRCWLTSIAGYRSLSAGAFPEEFPAPADIIQNHADALGIALRTARFHVLHRDSLEAVVYRPRHHAYYRGADPVGQAAVLCEGLAREHCFVDGNKRTAWLALRTYLAVKAGIEVEADAAEAADWMLRLTMGDRSASELAAWIRKHLRPAKGRF